MTSIIAVLIGFASTYFVKLVNPEDGEQIKASLEGTTNEEITEGEEDISIADRTVSLLTVDDFYKLLSKENIGILWREGHVGFYIRQASGRADPPACKNSVHPIIHEKPAKSFMIHIKFEICLRFRRKIPSNIIGKFRLQ